MKQVYYVNQMPYIYDPTRKGAKYSLDGGKSWKNHGEFLESVAKFHRGLEYLVNPTTSWDTGSDIESLNASVKSSKCSLATIYGNSFADILDSYFENVHSTLWIYMVEIDNTIYEYHMDACEFREFLETWGTLDRESGSKLMKVRIKSTTAKMVAWLNSKSE